MFDHVYFYTCDEALPGNFSLVGKTASALRLKFPEVLLLTTAYQRGMAGKLSASHVATWCPNAMDLNREEVVQAREMGHQVWWYVCTAPEYR